MSPTKSAPMSEKKPMQLRLQHRHGLSIRMLVNLEMFWHPEKVEVNWYHLLEECQRGLGTKKRHWNFVCDMFVRHHTWDVWAPQMLMIGKRRYPNFIDAAKSFQYTVINHPFGMNVPPNNHLPKGSSTSIVVFKMYPCRLCCTRPHPPLKNTRGL